ncbi:MAG: hypothetical protein K9G62_04340 [Alphaproteobacteria bacterium]|nr:hypothetical protein [Alphaproteobacteria bacterium]
MGLSAIFNNAGKWSTRLMMVGMPAMAIAMGGADPSAWLGHYVDHCYGGFLHMGQAASNLSAGLGLSGAFNGAALGAAGAAGLFVANGGHHGNPMHTLHALMMVGMAIASVASGIDPSMWLGHFVQMAYGGILHAGEALTNVDVGLNLGLGLDAGAGDMAHHHASVPAVQHAGADIFSSRREWFEALDPLKKDMINSTASAMGVSVEEYTKTMCAIPGLRW